MPTPVRPAPTPTKPPPRRRRWWKRLIVAVVLLGAAGLGGFTWFAYWPLEGRVDRVEALVPVDVDFLYRTSWREVKAAGWVRKHVLDEPVHPDLDLEQVVVSGPREPRESLKGALERIPEHEAEINGQIPAAVHVLQGLVFGTTEFRVEKDLFPGEIVAAGRWCGGGSPQEGPPKWRELLLLTRVSAQVKFAFEALRHDFVRERAVARGDLELTVTGDGLLRVELLGTPPPRRRQTCEGGFEAAPTNVWYVARVKDVLAISNAEDLAVKVKGVAAGEGDAALYGRDFEMERPEAGVAAALDLVGLRSYLARFFADEEGQKVGSFVGKFLAVDSLETAKATVGLVDDGVVVRADVGYAEGRLREFKDVAATYDQPLQSVAGGICRLLPAKDTAIVVQLSTPPRALLRAVYDSLDVNDRKLVAARVAELSVKRKADGQAAYDDVYAFLDDLSTQLGSSSAVAVARISAAFTDDMYREWYSIDDPDPTATLAIMVKIKDGARQADVDAFLADRVAALGALPPEPVTSPEGIEYSRIKFVDLPRQYRLNEPAFKVHDGYLVLATREEYLLEILKVMRGGPGAPASFVSTREFQDVARSLPSEATLSMHVNGDALREIAWDFRNSVVRRRNDDDEHALAFRSQRMAERARARGGRGDFAEDKKAVDAEVAEEMKRFRSEGYREMLAAYRKELDATRRVAALGVAIAARRGEGHLDAAARVLFRPAPGRAAPAPTDK